MFPFVVEELEASLIRAAGLAARKYIPSMRPLSWRIEQLTDRNGFNRR